METVELKLELPVDVATELVETSALAMLLGREDLTIARLVEMHYRQEMNSFPQLWTTMAVMSKEGDRNVRTLRLGQNHQESEVDFNGRKIGLLQSLGKAIKKSTLPTRAKNLLQDGYESLCVFYTERNAELMAHEQAVQANALEVERMESASRVEALRKHRANVERVRDLNMNMPYDKLRAAADREALNV
jgi:hypothetical protein